MAKTLYATYDGHVFTPENDIDLLPNRYYSIRIEMQPAQKLEPGFFQTQEKFPL